LVIELQARSSGVSNGILYMRKLNKENLKSRRSFIKSSAKKAIVPVVTVLVVAKTAPKLFAREPE